MAFITMKRKTIYMSGAHTINASEILQMENWSKRFHFLHELTYIEGHFI